MSESKYAAQIKHLSQNRKQLRVWVEAEKYAVFQELVMKNETSIYALVNGFINDYIQNNH